MARKQSSKRTFRNSEDMFPLIKMWQSGDQTQLGFCKKQGISISVFRYWLAKYRDQYRSANDEEQAHQHAAGFISFHPGSLPDVREIALEVQIPDGKILRFQQLPPQSYLNGLLTGL